MKPFFVLWLFVVSLTSGCSSLNDRTTEFRIHTVIGFSIDGNWFDVVEVQPSETLLWQDSELVGIITAINTDPQFQTAMEEVKRGFEENLKSSEATRKLDLPRGVFGFASSMRGFTTAFVAVEAHEGTWVTISVRDSFFKEILSSISVD